MRRVLPFAVLLALGIPGLYAQGTAPLDLDCGQPADVQLSSDKPQANLKFSGTFGEAVYIRLLASQVDSGFGLNLPVVADPFGNKIEHWTDGDLVNDDYVGKASRMSPEGLSQWGPPLPADFYK